MCPNVGSCSLEHALAHGNTHVAAAHLDDVTVLWPSRSRNPLIELIHRLTTSLTTPHWKGKPTGTLDHPLKSWITQSKHNQSINHPIVTSSLHQSITHPNPQTHPKPQHQTILDTTMPAAVTTCCINPTRSLSPTEPARRPPSTVNLNTLFAVAALPNDHPHSLKLPVQDRRPPKHLVRSPSFVGKLKGQLRRRGTVRSLRAEVVREGEGEG